MEQKTSLVRHFQDLRVWKEAHAFSLAVYQATQRFPKDELYGLTSQFRRAAVSIELNIAEGSKRETTKDLCHFLNMSEGSTEEAKCLLLLARDLRYIEQTLFQTLWDKASVISAMLNSLIRSLRSV